MILRMEIIEGIWNNFGANFRELVTTKFLLLHQNYCAYTKIIALTPKLLRLHQNCAILNSHKLRIEAFLIDIFEIVRLLK